MVFQEWTARVRRMDGTRAVDGRYACGRRTVRVPFIWMGSKPILFDKPMSFTFYITRLLVKKRLESFTPSR